MFPFLIPLLGAGVGAALNKKNPLQGALMGGALGATGGMAAGAMGLGGAGAAGSGGLLGTGAAEAAGAGSTGLLSSAAPSLGSAGEYFAATQGAGAAQPGLLASLTEYAKPIGNAMDAAGKVKEMTGGDQQINIPSPVITPNLPNNTLGQLATNIDTQRNQQMQMDEQKRQMRRNMIRGIA